MPALLALLAALGQLPAPVLAEPGERTSLSAESVEFDAEARTLRAEGGVLLESGGVRLFTEELAYDLQSGAGRAGGGLLLLDGTLVLLAREGTFLLGDGGALALEDAVLLQKAGPPSVLEGVRDAQAARRAGRNALLLRAAHLERVARGRFLARRLRLTSCDCGPEASPDWSISAREADVEPGERAILWWPAFYVKDVPVFALPALYVPLSSRRTGFLFPRPNYSASNGFFFDQPFFWALGESYDLTFTLGHRFGSSEWTEVEGEGGVVQEVFTRTGSRGPRGSLELRYAPASGTFGSLFVAGLYDLHRNVEAGPARGWRGNLAWRHGSELPGGFAARADVSLVSDAYYVADEAVEPSSLQMNYLRSQAWAGWRGAGAAIALGTGWYQDLAAPPAPDRWFFGDDAPASLQRPLAVVLSLPSARLVGPLRAGLEVEAARSQALSLFAGPAAPGTLGLTRLVLAPSLSWPLLDGGPVRAELYARGRQDTASYSGLPGGTEPEIRGRLVAGAWSGTELSRTFLSGTLKHSIEPRVEVRAATRRFGQPLVLAEGRVGPVDEFDEREDAFVQGVAAVATRLLRRGRGELLRLELGQDFDLLEPELADAFGRIAIRPSFVQAGAEGRWDWGRRRLASLNAWLSAADARGDSLRLTYDRLLEGGTDRMRATLEALFGPPAPEGSDGSYDNVGAALSVTVIQGIALRYSASLNASPASEGSFLDRILVHSGAASFTSACDCWRLDLGGLYVPSTGQLAFTFLVDLKNLGSFGR